MHIQAKVHCTGKRLCLCLPEHSSTVLAVAAGFLDRLHWSEECMDTGNAVFGYPYCRNGNLRLMPTRREYFGRSNAMIILQVSANADFTEEDGVH